MKILFLTHSYPNYVPDLLLHGLRKLIGPDVVEFPRKDCLYQGVLGLGICPANQLCPGWFPEDNGRIDREDIPSKIKRGAFHLIISDVRVWGQWAPQLERSPSALAIVDGEDRPVFIPPGRYVVCRRETDGSDFSIPLPMALPEEIFNWITAFDGLPKRYSIGFLGSTQDGRRKALIEQLSRWYPDGLYSASIVPSPSNPFPEGRYAREDYYRRLQQCRFVLSLEGAGCDTFRFWENAACNAVHVAQRMPLFIPNDFENNRSIVRFATIEHLRAGIDRILAEPDNCQELVINGRWHLTNFHFTTSRARYLLDRIQHAFKL